MPSQDDRSRARTCRTSRDTSGATFISNKNSCCCFFFLGGGGRFGVLGCFLCVLLDLVWLFLFWMLCWFLHLLCFPEVVLILF